MNYFGEISFFNSDGTHYQLTNSFDSSYEASLWGVSYIEKYSEFNLIFEVYEIDDGVLISEMEVELEDL